MRRQQLAGAATIAVGVAMITNAVLGPLALGVIRFHESASMETQLLGAEMTSLLIAGPLAIVAGVLWWRGARSAPILAFGPLGYALYTYVQLILVPDYARYDGNNERFFVLYLLVILTSWIMIVEAWREVQIRPPIPPTRRAATLLGGTLLGASSLFAVAWWGSIVGLYLSAPSLQYRGHPTGFWLVRLMDLGFVIPISLVTGLGLVRRRPWASTLGYAVAGVQMLLACAVAGMAVRMAIVSDPSANAVFAAVAALGAGLFVILYGSLIGRLVAIERRINDCASRRTRARTAPRTAWQRPSLVPSGHR